MSWMRACSKRLKPYVAPLLCALVIAALSVTRVLERAGEPALPLDDSFIHLQYARRLAEGHWFAYAPGGGYTAGATSILWPMALAPFFLLGFDELSIVWVMWLLGCLVHAAVALETARVVEPLTSRGVAIAAGAMCLVFGALVWFAASGMETVALSWILMRGVRVASERCEGSARSPWEMVALSFVAPLVRPEGAVVSLFGVIVGVRALVKRRKAAPELLSLAAPLVVPAMHRLLGGRAASNTAIVKWLALDPYLDGAGVVRETLDNAHLLVTDLLAGGAWTWLFVPEGFVYALGGGLVMLAIAGMYSGHRWRAVFVALAVLATLLPCTYSTMLWNRVRYIWPFAPAWFAAVACLGHMVGRWLGRRAAPLGSAGAALLWGGVAMLAAKLPLTMDDVATSARAIDLQQVALGRWARTLPDDAVIGVNDTGAIAYMSRHATFDVVGLTTQGEARYWAEGAGSRFEHYEALERSRLPTHFIVYPGWMQMPAVLGEELTEATVIDQSILGGRTMVAYAADYRLLGSGARPFTPGFTGEPLNELDISDLESETSHRYRRGDALARYNVAAIGYAPDGREIAEGGRLERAEDRFDLTLPHPSVMVMRVSSSAPLEVWLGLERLGEARPLSAAEDWEERAIDMPATTGPQVVVVRATARVRFTSYHYWWFER